MKEAGGKIDAKITVDFYNQGAMGAEYIIDKVGKEGKLSIAGNEGGTQLMLEETEQKKRSRKPVWKLLL